MIAPETREAARAEGAAARDAAHALLAERRATYIRRGRRALLRELLLSETATADDVRDAVALPDEIDPVCMGPVPIPLARARIIRAAGYEPTSRAAGHARPLTRWALADRPAAIRWLAENPDLPDPAEDAGPGLLFA